MAFFLSLRLVDNNISFKILKRKQFFAKILSKQPKSFKNDRIKTTTLVATTKNE